MLKSLNSRLDAVDGVYMKILVFSDRDIKHPFSGGSMINPAFSI